MRTDSMTSTTMSARPDGSAPRAAPPRPSVAVIILNYDNADDTIACVESLRGITYPAARVLVVDNASPGPDADRIEAAHGDWVEVLRSPMNVGYSGGNNLGILHALRDGPDYVLILNNDVVVAPDFLDAMVDVAESEPRVGIVGPVQYYMDRPEEVFSAGADISVPLGLIRQRRLTGPDRRAGRTCVEVPILSGACMLVPRGVVERVGVLPDDYFLQWEDADYSSRMGLFGLRCLCAHRSRVWHRVNASLGASGRHYAAVERGFRNRIVYFRRYLRPAHFWVFAAWYAGVMAPVWVLYYLARYRDPRRARHLLAGMARGFRAAAGMTSHRT